MVDPGERIIGSGEVVIIGQERADLFWAVAIGVLLVCMRKIEWWTRHAALAMIIEWRVARYTNHALDVIVRHHS